MSHQPERKEKDCLNCGTTVAGRYCQHCGQENIVARQNALSLVSHFIYDVFHFDGKFFDTLGRLFARPGQVPKEYVMGRRVSYLDPIRMYLFTSAIFFLVFFAFKDIEGLSGNFDRSMTRSERFRYASAIFRIPDAELERQLPFVLDSSYELMLYRPDRSPRPDTSFFISLDGVDYLMVPQGPDSSRQGSSWFDRNYRAKKADLAGKYGDDQRAMFSAMLKSFLHKMPYLLFVSLPLFAFFLKLLFMRRKDWLYSDHAVFTLYHYIFSFILMLFVLVVDKAGDATGWKAWKILGLALLAWGGIYLYLSMKRFYGQGYGKTLGKFLLLNLMAFVMLLVLFLAFLIYSFFQF